jgi:hypothetical protein
MSTPRHEHVVIAATACGLEGHQAAAQSGGFNLSRELLRRRLIRKARQGQFDVEFFSYWGVDPRVNRGCRRAARRGYAAKLVPTSTRRFPPSLTGSYHTRRELDGDGLGIDLGNTARHVGPTAEGRRRLAAYQLDEFRAWQQGKRPNMVELIGPDNHAIVLRGEHQPLPNGHPLEDQHDNHVHQAFRR